MGLFSRGSVTRYIPEEYYQDTNLSLVSSDGRYDPLRLSGHESDVIVSVLLTTAKKYPQEYQAIGLANESYEIKYKPRYILFEAVIQLYKDSEQPWDRFAVAMAHETKGAYHRREAIEYFERALPYISDKNMESFLSFIPLAVYSRFEKVYEGEHIYGKAIECAEKARRYSEPGNAYFDNLIARLREKESSPPTKRTMKQSASAAEFERGISDTAMRLLSAYRKAKKSARK